MLNLKKQWSSRTGVILFSILLGLGLSILLKLGCDHMNYQTYLSPFEEKVVRYKDKCYEPNKHVVSCDPTKIIIDV